MRFSKLGTGSLRGTISDFISESTWGFRWTTQHYKVAKPAAAFSRSCSLPMLSCLEETPRDKAIIRKGDTCFWCQEGPELVTKCLPPKPGGLGKIFSIQSLAPLILNLSRCEHHCNNHHISVDYCACKVLDSWFYLLSWSSDPKGSMYCSLHCRLET